MAQLLHTHLSGSVAGGAIEQDLIELPSLPQIALVIRRVRVGFLEPGANAMWAFSHFTGDHTQGSSGSPSFYGDVRGKWLQGSPGGNSSGGGHLTEDLRFGPEDLWVAGDQAFVQANNAGFTMRWFVDIFYAQRPIDLPQWTLLKSRTSYEED